MAKITWRDRANSGTDSAISASIFNEIKSSINSLYTELEDVINLSGSANQRGGSSKYITPIAIYDPNDSNNVIDFSNGKFDFKGGDLDVRKDLHIRGAITASGYISASSGGVFRGLFVPNGFIKVGTGSTHITNEFIKTHKITSNDPNVGESDYAGNITANSLFADVAPGVTQIVLSGLNDDQDDGSLPPSLLPGNRIQFNINNKKVVNFFESGIEFRTHLFVLTEGGDVDEDGTIIPINDNNAGSDRMLLYDATDGQIKYRQADTFISSLSSNFEGFISASIIEDFNTNDSIVGNATTNLEFKFNNGLKGIIASPNGPLQIGTSSLFTASYASYAELATSSSHAITSSHSENAISSSYAFSSSYALSASFAPATPTPSWDEVLTVGSDATQNIYLNGNNKIVLGTTEAENATNGVIYFNSNQYLQIDAGNHIFFNPSNNIGIGTSEPTEKTDIGGNLRVQGAISASDLPTVSGENTLVLWNGHKLVSNEFSTLLDANTFNAYATASFGNAGEVIATSATSAFQFGFESGLSGSIQSGILTIGTSSAFTASHALTAITASYITADNIDQPFSVLHVTGDITASLISASAGITSSDVYINDWGSVSASLSAAVNSNDNLGNHTASADFGLNMNDKHIYNVTNITASGVISASSGFIGDLTGTASYADLATTASYVTSSNVYGPHGFDSILSSSYAITSSYSVSSSHAESADLATSATTASHALNANTSITASHVADALYSASISDATITYHQFDGDTFVHTVDNVVTAQTASYVTTAQTASFVVSAISASHVADAFTTVAGNNTDTLILTQMDGDTSIITINNVVSASHAFSALTASYVENAQTASYVENAQTASYVENAQTASYVEQAVSASFATTASYFDITFGSTNQGTLTASINGVESYTDLGVQTTDNVTFANLTATGNTIKLTGVPNSSGITTPLVIDDQGCIFTGSAYTAYTPSGDFNGFYAAADTGTNLAIDAADVLEIIGDLDTPGITTTVASSGGGGGTIKITLNNILSSSAQIASNISGAFNGPSSSIATDINNLQTSASAGIYFSELANLSDGFTLSPFESGTFDAGGGDGLVLEINGTNILYKLVGVLSSSQQIATDISGAIDAATSSLLNDYGLLSSSQQIATDISGAINIATSSILNDYGLLSSSAQISSEISGAIDIATGSLSSSLASDISGLELSASAGIFFRDSDGLDPGFSVPLMGTASFVAAGNAYDSGFFNITAVDSAVSYSLDLPNNLLSSSQQIETDISGAINSATQSILNDYGLISGSVEVNQNAFATASIFGTDLELIANSTIDNLIFQAGPGISITTSSAGGGAIYLTASGIADNLGNHIAEQNLIMGNGSTNYSINNVDDITVYGDVRLLGLNKISFDADNTNTYIAANAESTEDLEIHADGDILLNPDFNVGIGIATNEPTEKLDVGGKVRATHFLATGGSGVDPSFAFAGDPDTGLFRPAPSNLALQINGSTVEFSLNETTGATLNGNLSVRGDISTSTILGDAGNISASGYLQSTVIDVEDYPSNASNHVVLYDTSSGRFFYTGSYGGGGTVSGGSTGVGDAAVLTLLNNTSNTANIGTISLNPGHSYIRAEFYAKSGSVIQAARSVFVFDKPGTKTEVTTIEDIRTDDTHNLFDINSVTGSWDVNNNLRVKLNQYNDLNVTYKFRYILI